jgi:hypothetical protein
MVTRILDAQWVRVAPEVAPGGHVGGDDQVGEAFSARWTMTLKPNLVCVVTRTYYAATDQTNARHPACTHLECDTEYLVCTDPADPGGTEVWSDNGYSRVRQVDAAWAGRTETGRTGMARRAAQHAPTPTMDEWYWASRSWR